MTEEIEENDDSPKAAEAKKNKIVTDLATKVDKLNEKLKDEIINPPKRLSGDALLNAVLEQQSDGYSIGPHSDTDD
jgi:hypothetical protein